MPEADVFVKVGPVSTLPVANNLKFNSATSMGRLVLNVLFSFAQFEREIISERTRDKIAAARRKGKWSGGMPLLGYDVDPQSPKLVVNEAEATRVRATFDLYLGTPGLAHQALDDAQGPCPRRHGVHADPPLPLAHPRHLHRQDPVQERNPSGPTQGIVDPDVWHRVQALLCRHGRRDPVRHQSDALLRRVLRCVACNCRMTPTYFIRNASSRYRYYVCSNAQGRGWQKCPSKSISAKAIEQFVVDQIRTLAARGFGC